MAVCEGSPPGPRGAVLAVTDTFRADILPTLQTHAQAWSHRVLRGSHAQTQPAERNHAVRHP